MPSNLLQNAKLSPAGNLVTSRPRPENRPVPFTKWFSLREDLIATSLPESPLFRKSVVIPPELAKNAITMVLSRPLKRRGYRLRTIRIGLDLLGWAERLAKEPK